MTGDDIPGVSLREFARMRGVSLPAVQKAIKAGRITKLPNGRLDPVKAAADWEANTSKAQQRGKHSEFTAEGQAARSQADGAKAAALGLPPPAAPSPAAPGPAPDGGGLAAGTITEHRTKREQYLAEMAQLEFEQARGRLVDAEEVKTTWAKQITSFKTRVLGVPAKLKTLIPGLSIADIAKIKGVLGDILEEQARDGGA